MFILAYLRESQEILWEPEDLALESECVWLLYHPNPLRDRIEESNGFIGHMTLPSS